MKRRSRFLHRLQYATCKAEADTPETRLQKFVPLRATAKRVRKGDGQAGLWKPGASQILGAQGAGGHSWLGLWREFWLGHPLMFVKHAFVSLYTESGVSWHGENLRRLRRHRSRGLWPFEMDPMQVVL